MESRDDGPFQSARRAIAHRAIAMAAPNVVPLTEANQEPLVRRLRPGWSPRCEGLTAHAVRHAVQGTGGAAKLADGKVPVRDSFAHAAFAARQAQQARVLVCLVQQAAAGSSCDQPPLPLRVP